MPEVIGRISESTERAIKSGPNEGNPYWHIKLGTHTFNVFNKAWFPLLRVGRYIKVVYDKQDGQNRNISMIEEVDEAVAEAAQAQAVQDDSARRASIEAQTAGKMAARLAAAGVNYGLGLIELTLLCRRAIQAAASYTGEAAPPTGHKPLPANAIQPPKAQTPPPPSNGPGAASPTKLTVPMFRQQWEEAGLPTNPVEAGYIVKRATGHESVKAAREANFELADILAACVRVFQEEEMPF